jgi:hypothetical protein
MLLYRLDRRLATAIRLVGLALIAWSVFGSPHHPGTSGRALVVTVALAAAVAAWLAWTVRPYGQGPITPELYVMAAAGGVLCGASPQSAASGFVFVAAPTGTPSSPACGAPTSWLAKVYRRPAARLAHCAVRLPQRRIGSRRSWEYRMTADAELTIDGDRSRLAGPTGQALLRVVQEALTNVRKHAPGAGVSVAVHAGEGPGDDVVLLVDDRLTGDRPAPVPGELAAAGGGYGLQGMRERAQLLGGMLDAGEAPDGWRVELRLPPPTETAVPAPDGR